MKQLAPRYRAFLLASSTLLAGVAACGDDTPEPVDDTSAVPDVDSDVTPDAGDASEPDVGEDTADTDLPDIERGEAPEADGIYGFAHGCYAVEAFNGREIRYLQRDGDRFEFVNEDDASPDAASRFHMRAADLGTYLFYDTERGFLTATETPNTGAPDDENAPQFARAEELLSEVQVLDETFISPAEWDVEVSVADADRFQLRHRASGQFLTFDGLTPDAEDAAVVAFYPREDCADFPELTLDATGAVGPGLWDDGELFGYAETHSHIMTNWGFGGGNMFHGAPFHRLGVEHALGSCEGTHGFEGRRDLIGVFYDGNAGFDFDTLLPLVGQGEAQEFVHATDGYPTFSEWPNGWARSTHQVMYYRGIERAYMSGLRLIVQHATGNSVLCELVEALTDQETLYGCNDMVSVDRSIQEMRSMERYIDAQAGGPGMGWMRIVGSPEEAREVIAEGKLAIILGVEISNLFDCFITPPIGYERCTEADVIAKLDHYYDLGVRVLFPVHKFDNGFSAGDGSDGVIELGNIINSGYYTNQVEDCPFGRLTFDGRDVSFGDLNEPRDEYAPVPTPLNMLGFGRNPIGALAPIVSRIDGEPLRGQYCQNAGMTDLGEFLMVEMMKRGMVPDIAHLPQHSVARALELLDEYDYPALSTHGRQLASQVYETGGMMSTGLGRCGATDGTTDTLGNGMRANVQQRIEAGLPGGEAFAFDANGFAGAARPRFGDRSGCAQPQANPIEYPFTSYDGEVEFQQPHLGDREVDFNNEGMIHFGLLPEYIQDARNDGMSDEDLEPLFRSAESVVLLWEDAEDRAAAIRGE